MTTENQNLSGDILFELVNEMHSRFGFHDVAEKMDEETFWKFIKFRVEVQMQEELNEILEAIDNRDAEEVFDGLIDIDVFQKGTVDFLVSRDAYLEGYKRVMDANLNKKTGIKPGRPNPWGFPDLIKPEGWTAPTHEGLLGEIESRMTQDEGEDYGFTMNDDLTESVEVPVKHYIEVPEHLKDRAQEIIKDLVATMKTVDEAVDLIPTLPEHHRSVGYEEVGTIDYSVDKDGRPEWKPNITQIRLKSAN